MKKQVEIIRSNRKTMSLQIQPDGRIVVRAPYRMPEAQIRDFVYSKEAWIKKHLRKIEERQAAVEALPAIDENELRELSRRAHKDIPFRVEYFAEKVGVTYGRISIRHQTTRWGSCSSKGNLNFNCLLMLAPEEVRDYVVVHELCHRLEMNHSARFWQQVARVLPDYKRRERWLKENGGILIGGMKKGMEEVAGDADII